MSMRSVSISTDKEQIAKNFMRSFIDLVEHFIDEEAHFDTVYKCIITLFNVMSAEDRSLVLKKILMHFLKKFRVDCEDIAEADEYVEKTLDLWRIFGMCSKTMGPVAILEKIEDTYAGCWQYYKMYAESLIEEDRAEELYKTFKNCMEHCNLSNEEVRQIFGPKVMALIKFPQISGDDEDTVQFMQVRQNDIRKSLAARRRSIGPKADLKTPQAVLSEHKPIVLAKIEKPTDRVPPKDDFTVFKDPTIATRQSNAFIRSTGTSSHDLPKDDFTMFRDPKVKSGQRKSFEANEDSPTVCGTHFVPKKPGNTTDPLLTSTPDNVRKTQSSLDYDSSLV